MTDETKQQGTALLHEQAKRGEFAARVLRASLAAASDSLSAALQAGDEYDLRNDAADKLQDAARIVHDLERFMGKKAS